LATSDPRAQIGMPIRAPLLLASAHRNLTMVVDQTAAGPPFHRGHANLQYLVGLCREFFCSAEEPGGLSVLSACKVGTSPDGKIAPSHAHPTRISTLIRNSGPRNMALGRFSASGGPCDILPGPPESNGARRFHPADRAKSLHQASWSAQNMFGRRIALYGRPYLRSQPGLPDRQSAGVAIFAAAET